MIAPSRAMDTMSAERRLAPGAKEGSPRFRNFPRGHSRTTRQQHLLDVVGQIGGGGRQPGQADLLPPLPFLAGRLAGRPGDHVRTSARMSARAVSKHDRAIAEISCGGSQNNRRLPIPEAGNAQTCHSAARMAGGPTTGREGGGVNLAFFPGVAAGRSADDGFRCARH
jgi:hypothetical protein